MKKATLIICALAASLLWAVDEPDELSWERFSKDVEMFRHFCSWVQKHSAVKLTPPPPMPEAFPVVRVKAESFKWGNWQHAKTVGVPVVRGRFGHNAGYTRAKMSVAQSGFYRVWCKYHHVKNTTASFRLNILPAGMQAYHPKFVDSRGQYYSWRFDWKFTRSKLKNIPDNTALPTGWIKESGPCVYLEKGEYTLELANLVHAGPYNFRNVAEVVLCADPLRDIDTIAAGASTVAPCEEFKAAWQLWNNRPGNGEIKEFHRAWRKDFLDHLAGDKLEGKANLWATLVCFDEKYNLIGNPGSIKEYIAENRKNRAFDPRPEDFVYEVEAESLQCNKVKSPWEVRDADNASGGKALFAYWGNTADTATGSVILPGRKRYYVWSRYRMLVRYLAPFEVEFNGGGRFLGKVTFGLPEKRISQGDFFWECKSIELPAGKVTFTVTKSGGRATTPRWVDSFVITDSAKLRPVAETVYQPLGKGLTVWHQHNPWGVISRKGSPKASDRISPEKVELFCRSGDVVNAVLNLRNDSGEFITVKPAASGKIIPQIRLVAYMQTPLYGWTPVVLLERKKVSAVPFQNTALQLTFSAKGVAPGRYETVVDAGKKVRYIINVLPAGKQGKAPLAGMWCAPLYRTSCWELFRDIGINIWHGRFVSDRDMKKYGVKLMPVGAAAPEEVRALQESLLMSGVENRHWAAIISDEPNARTYKKWIGQAKKLREEFPDLQIWCNPGEVQSSTPEAVKAMAPYVDVFCPYVNHFRSKDSEHIRKTLPETGKIKLLYTTPCFHEKSPASPMQIFAVARAAKRYKRHGFNFFSGFSTYTYSNSIWDEMNAMNAAQSVNFYPGSNGRTLSTRNLEALREAIQEFRNE